MASPSRKEFDQFKYQNEFNKMNYDRVEIIVPKGQKAVIKEFAKAAGQSVSEYISQAVRERMEKENLK
ncbi:MAG: ribbon-helix-helix domain-containing protein [bacterium]|nr:ribbon-helix-helix domain-containing protein [bacterium]